MKEKLVSILVPVYGVEKFIERNAVSLFEQTYQNLEYIFVDDCSPDRSIDILISVIDRYPNRKHQVKIIRHIKNKGLAAARNTAVSNACGDFIWHIDSDDYVSTNAVDILMKKQDKDNSDIVFMELRRLGKNYSYVIKRPEFSNNIEWTCAFLARNSFVSMCDAIIRRSLYVNYNIEEKVGINMGEDFQTLPRLTYYATKISVVHQPLYFYVMLNDSSFSNSFSTMKNNQYWSSIEVLDNFFRDKGNNYISALEIGKLNICLEMLRGCTREYGNEVAFYELRSKLKMIDKQAVCTLSVPYRILCYINNYTLVHWYVRILGYLKRMFLSLKS